ncbi:MAG: glycosyltransferase family 4 protein, partial [Nanoarchaeota archaeon]
HKDANVFVMPSLMEAFGQVYLEALATKTPAIGTRVGGVPDIITPDVGYLVPPRNSDEISKHIIELFSDPKKAKKMGEAGRNRVKKKFSIEKMVKETEDVYKSLI